MSGGVWGLSAIVEEGEKKKKDEKEVVRLGFKGALGLLCCGHLPGCITVIKHWHGPDSSSANS